MNDDDAIRIYRREAHFEKGKWVLEETLKIHLDEFPESPREWDNVSRMVCLHGRYKLGDENNINYDDFSNWNELEEYLIKEEGAYLIYPLSLLRPQRHHDLYRRTKRSNGIQGGLIVYVTKETIESEYGKLTRK